MAESLAFNPNDVNSDAAENLPASEPLGNKNPLLGITPLWQNALSPKFLTPLGAKPLSVLDPSIFFPKDTSETSPLGDPFATPFFAQPSTFAQPDSSGIDSSGMVSAAAETQSLGSSRIDRFADRQSSRIASPELIQARQASTSEISAERIYPQSEVIQAFVDPYVPQTSSESAIPASDLEIPLRREFVTSSQAPLIQTPSTPPPSAATGDHGIPQSPPSPAVVQRTPSSNVVSQSVASELQRDGMTASSPKAVSLPISPSPLQRSSAPPAHAQSFNLQETEGQLGDFVSDTVAVTPSIAPEAVQRKVLSASDSTQPDFSVGDQQSIIQRSLPTDVPEPVLGLSTGFTDAMRPNSAALPMVTRATDFVESPRADIPPSVPSLPSVRESSPPDFVPSNTVVQAQRDLNPSSSISADIPPPVSLPFISEPSLPGFVSGTTVVQAQQNSNSSSVAATDSSLNTGLVPAQRSPEPPTTRPSSDAVSADLDLSAPSRPTAPSSPVPLSEANMMASSRETGSETTTQLDASSLPASPIAVQRQVDSPRQFEALTSDSLNMVQRQVDPPTLQQLPNDLPLPNPAPTQRQVDPATPQHPIVATSGNAPTELVSRTVSSEQIPLEKGVVGTPNSLSSQPIQAQAADDSDVMVASLSSFSPSPSTIVNTSFDELPQGSDVPSIQAKAVRTTESTMQNTPLIADSQEATIGQQASAETALTQGGISNPTFAQSSDPARAESVSTPLVVQRTREAAPALSPLPQLESTEQVAHDFAIQPKSATEAEVAQTEPIASQSIASGAPTFLGSGIASSGADSTSTETPVVQAQRETTLATEAESRIVVPQATASVTSESPVSPVISTSDVPVVQRRQAASDGGDFEAIVPQTTSVVPDPVMGADVSRNIGYVPVVQAQRATAFAAGDSSESIAPQVVSSVSALENSPSIQLQPDIEVRSPASTDALVQPKLEIPASEMTEATMPPAGLRATELELGNVESDRPSAARLSSSIPNPLGSNLDAAVAPVVLQARSDNSETSVSEQLGDLPESNASQALSPKLSQPGPFQSALNLLKPLTRLFQPTDRSPQLTSEAGNSAKAGNLQQAEPVTTSRNSPFPAPVVQAKMSADAIPDPGFAGASTETPDLISSLAAASEPTLTPSGLLAPLNSVTAGDSPVIQAATTQISEASLNTDLSSDLAGAIGSTESSFDRPTAISQPSADSISKAIPSHPGLLSDGESSDSQSTLPDAYPSPSTRTIQRATSGSTPLTFRGDTGLPDEALQNPTIATSNPSELGSALSSNPSNLVEIETGSFNSISQMAEFGQEAVSIPVQLKADEAVPQTTSVNLAGQELLSALVQPQVEAFAPQTPPLSSAVFPGELAGTVASDAGDAAIPSINLPEDINQHPTLPVQRKIEAFPSQTTSAHPVISTFSESISQEAGREITAPGASSTSGSQPTGTDWGSLQTPVQRQVDESMPSITPVAASSADLLSSQGSTSAIESLPIQRKVTGTEAAIGTFAISNPDNSIVPNLPEQNQNNSVDTHGLGGSTAVSPLETPSVDASMTPVAPIQGQVVRRQPLVPKALESGNGFLEDLATSAVTLPDAPAASGQFVRNVEPTDLMPTLLQLRESAQTSNISSELLQLKESAQTPSISSDVSSNVSHVEPSPLQRHADGQPFASSPSSLTSGVQLPIEQTLEDIASVPMTSNALESTFPAIQARLEDHESRVPALPISSDETIVPASPITQSDSSATGFDETTTLAANSVLQAFSDPTAVPQLPTVLENLSVLKPLTSTLGLNLSNPPLSAAGTSLIQARFLTESSSLPEVPLGENITDSPVPRVSSPTNGSSDRFSPIPSSPIPSSPIPSSPTSSPLIPITDLAPSTLPIQRHADSPVAAFGGLSDSWSSMDELLTSSPTLAPTSTNGYDPLPLPKPDASRSKLGGNAQTNSGSTLIQAFPDPNAFSIQRVEAKTQATDEPSEEEVEAADLRSLEVLAREIYSLVRQKMEIERERGGAYYSGRMPW